MKVPYISGWVAAESIAGDIRTSAIRKRAAKRWDGEKKKKGNPHPELPPTRSMVTHHPTMILIIRGTIRTGQFPRMQMSVPHEDVRSVHVGQCVTRKKRFRALINRVL